MGVCRPKSQEGLAWLAGPKGYTVLISSVVPSDPIGVTITEANSLTYAECWELLLEPAIKRQGERATVATSQQPHTRSGSFDPTRATGEEMDAFLNQFCGPNAKPYQGPRWWENPEAHGYKLYRGK